MAEDIEAVIVGIVKIAVRVALNVNLLQHGERLRIEHRDRSGGGESVSRRGIDGSAVRAHCWNVPDLDQRVEVEYADVAIGARPCDIQIATLRVRSYVIEAAVAAHQLDPQHLVAGAVLRVNNVRE